MIKNLKINGDNIYAAITASMINHYVPNISINFNKLKIPSKILIASPSFLQAINPFTKEDFYFELVDKITLKDWIFKNKSFDIDYNEKIGPAVSFDQKILFNNLNLPSSINNDSYDFVIDFNKNASSKEFSKILKNIECIYTQNNKLSQLTSQAQANGWSLNIPYNNKLYSYVYKNKSKNLMHWPSKFITAESLNLNFNLFEIVPVTVFANIFLIKLFVNYLVKFTIVEEHFIRNYNNYAQDLMYGINSYLSSFLVFSQRSEKFYSVKDRQSSDWNEMLIERQYKKTGNIFDTKEWNILAKNLKG